MDHMLNCAWPELPSYTLYASSLAFLGQSVNYSAQAAGTIMGRTSELRVRDHMRLCFKTMTHCRRPEAYVGTTRMPEEPL